MSPEVQPFFQPYVGTRFRDATSLPRKLLIVGESYYLTESDKRPEFTADLMQKITAAGSRSGGRIRFYRNLFHVITGMHPREATPDQWRALWENVAYYIYIQSTRLTAARMRPDKTEWAAAAQPFMTVLTQLQPEVVLFTGTQLCGHATKVGTQCTRRPGVLLPVGQTKQAYARCIYHPSSVKFLSEFDRCRQIVQELLA